MAIESTIENILCQKQVVIIEGWSLLRGGRKEGFHCHCFLVQDIEAFTILAKPGYFLFLDGLVCVDSTFFNTRLSPFTTTKHSKQQDVTDALDKLLFCILGIFLLLMIKHTCVLQSMMLWPR